MWSDSIKYLNPHKALKPKVDVRNDNKIIPFNPHAKANEVPKMYRRNRWNEFLELLLCAAMTVAVVVILMYMFIVFGQ